MAGRGKATEGECQAIVDYAADLMALLGYPHWNIMIMEELCDEEASASIDTIDNRHVARIYLAADWMTLRSEERREIITHEILHLLHRDLNDWVKQEVNDEVHDWRAMARLERQYHRHTELMVDHLAHFMATTHTLVDSWDKFHNHAQ